MTMKIGGVTTTADVGIVTQDQGVLHHQVSYEVKDRWLGTVFFGVCVVTCAGQRPENRGGVLFVCPQHAEGGARGTGGACAAAPTKIQSPTFLYSCLHTTPPLLGEAGLPPSRLTLGLYNAEGDAIHVNVVYDCAVDPGEGCKASSSATASPGASAHFYHPNPIGAGATPHCGCI